MQGHELRSLRKAMGMTQGQLAAALGFSHGFIGEMERGEKAIEPRTVLALRGLRAEREEDVSEHGFHVSYADRVDGWNVVFVHDGWRGMFGKRELVLYGSHGMQAFEYAPMLQMIESGRLQPQKLIGGTVSLNEACEILPRMNEFPGRGAIVIDRF